MKFNCDAMKDRRRARRRRTLENAMEWHTKFALFPIKVGPGDCRWLETVERRMHLTESFEACVRLGAVPGAFISWFYWEYRSVSR